MQGTTHKPQLTKPKIFVVTCDLCLVPCLPERQPARHNHESGSRDRRFSACVRHNMESNIERYCEMPVREPARPPTDIYRAKRRREGRSLCRHRSVVAAGWEGRGCCEGRCCCEGRSCREGRSRCARLCWPDSSAEIAPAFRGAEVERQLGRDGGDPRVDSGQRDRRTRTVRR